MGFRVVTSQQDENAEVGTHGDTNAITRLGEFIQWEWLQELHDWIDLSTGEILTGYEPTESFRELVRAVTADHPIASL